MQAIEGEPEVLVFTGSVSEPLPDCGLLLLTDEMQAYAADAHTYLGDETNAELVIAQDGTCRVRRLYG